MLIEPETWIRDLVKNEFLPRKFAVCELGDQIITHSAPHRLARELYVELGCGRYESIDGNARGTITADLNRPLEKDTAGKFDLVTDLGTGEHIFDQCQVWRSIHYLCKPGGFIIFDRPMLGYDEHCYYLIKPELVGDLAAANGYTVMKLETREMSRGVLLRGIVRRSQEPKRKFIVPQQGRYKKLLRPITRGRT